MLEEFRGWIDQHFNVALSFVIGLTAGISVFAIAYFSTRNDLAANVLRYGARITGHPDIGEDLVWFFCGTVAGAAITCLAWLRDAKAQDVGLDKADVLNRLFTDPAPHPDPNPERSGRNPSHPRGRR
jgi:hypothetical protein